MSIATATCTTADTDRHALTRQIEALVARLHPTVARERRHDVRVAIPVLLRLTPLDGNRQPIGCQAAIVMGKNISRRGLSFYHEGPMPHRRALIELAHPELGQFSAEIDINWCRFTRPGWYESGGRLLRLAKPDSYSTEIEIPRNRIPHGLPRLTGEAAAGFRPPPFEFQI